MVLSAVKQVVPEHKNSDYSPPNASDSFNWDAFNNETFATNNHQLFYINYTNYLNKSSEMQENEESGYTDNYWALLAIIIVIGTACGNILVCLAIAWEKRLQNVTNYFLASLALTDLMVAVLVMPLGILTLFRGKHDK